MRSFSMTVAPSRSITTYRTISGMPNGADPHVTRVEPLRPRGLRVRLHLDSGDPLDITLEALERSRLGVGDTLPPADCRRLLDTDADIRVREAALNILSYRARTRRELKTKLRQKGFQPSRIDACLDRLQEKGFVDDSAVAAAFIRDRLRHRPRGRARLSSELREKGVSPDLVDRTITRVFEDEEVSDLDLARRVAEDWVARQNPTVLTALATTDRSPERDRARRRLQGYLTRRGFRGDALYRAIDRVIELASS